MSVSIHKYSIDDFNSILFQGFNYKLPDETLNRISELALQVGSPDYVKTPVFQNKKIQLNQKQLEKMVMEVLKEVVAERHKKL